MTDRSDPFKRAAREPDLSQIDKFKAAARELGTDDDPERFKQRVRRIASAPVKDAPPKPKRPAGNP